VMKKATKMMLNPMMKTATKKRISKNDCCISEIIVLMFKSYFYLKFGLMYLVV